MGYLVKSYIKNDSAVDEAVSKIIFIVIAIGCSMAVGWFLWNSLQSKTEKTDCKNSSSPWCTE